MFGEEMLNWASTSKHTTLRPEMLPMAEFLCFKNMCKFKHVKIRCWKFNLLAPRGFEINFRELIFKQILVIDGGSISCEIVLTWTLKDLNIGSGNGLVPSGNKPLPEPMLTQFSVAIWLIIVRSLLLKYGRLVAKCDTWIHRATQGPAIDAPFGDQWIL